MRKRKNTKKGKQKYKTLNKILLLIIVIELLYISFVLFNKYIYWTKQGNQTADMTADCLQEGRRYSPDEGIANSKVCDLEITTDEDLNKLAEFSNRLTHVQTIYFRKTPNTNIPAEIGNLENLRVLNFHHTFNTSLPMEIGELSNLTDLNLNQTDIGVIPEDIGKLSNLKNLTINFSVNPVSIPDQVKNLYNLKILALDNNPEVVLPDELASLEGLEELDLSVSNLSEIPDFIYRMKNLKVLNISGNSLDDGAVENLRVTLNSTTIIY